MKIIITEEQYGIYFRRRVDCMRDYVDNLKSGEESLPVPSTSFEWDVYKYFMTASLRRRCGGRNYYDTFDEDIHNDIMKMFGDDLFEIYNS